MRYVILKPEQIRDVMSGKRNQLPVTDPTAPGSVIAVKTARNRRPTCLLEVTRCELDPPDGYVLTVREAALEHEPMLLAQDSSRGYTNDPRLAMRGEPEAIKTEALDQRWDMRSEHRHGAAQRERDEARRWAREKRSLEERIREAKQAARANGVNAAGELALVRKFIGQGRSESSVMHRLAVAERIAYREAA